MVSESDYQQRLIHNTLVESHVMTNAEAQSEEPLALQLTDVITVNDRIKNKVSGNVC